VYNNFIDKSAAYEELQVYILHWGQHWRVKLCRGNKSIVPYVLRQDSQWQQTVHFMPWLFYSHRNSSWYPWHESLCQPQRGTVETVVKENIYFHYARWKRSDSQSSVYLGVHTIKLTALSTLYQNEYCMLLYLHFSECLYFLACVCAPQNIPSSCLFLLGPPLPCLQPKLPALSTFVPPHKTYLLRWRWRQQAFTKWWYISAKLRGVASHRSVIFTEKLNYLLGFYDLKSFYIYSANRRQGETWPWSPLSRRRGSVCGQTSSGQQPQQEQVRATLAG
jgi:hypothetical protein